MIRTACAPLGVIACLLSACGASSPTIATPAALAPVLETVVFAFPPEVSAFTTIGATVQVTALGIFSSGPMRDVTPTCTDWRSDAPGVVTVTNGGLLTAQRTSGSVSISTTCQNVSTRGLITINPPPSLLQGPPPREGHGPPTGGAQLCLNPPYHFNDLAQRCQEDNGGQFAKNECCGRPPAEGSGR